MSQSSRPKSANAPIPELPAFDYVLNVEIHNGSEDNKLAVGQSYKVAVSVAPDRHLDADPVMRLFMQAENDMIEVQDDNETRYVLSVIEDKDEKNPRRYGGMFTITPMKHGATELSLDLLCNTSHLLSDKILVESYIPG